MVKRTRKPGIKFLRWTGLTLVAAMTLVFNPGVLTGCGPRPSEGGYGGCPQYQPTKQAVRDALDEAPRQYLVEHNDGTLQIDFTWSSDEVISRHDFSLIKSSHAFSYCSEIETIALEVSMTLTWIPHTGEPEVLAQDVPFFPTHFYESSTGVSETEDEVDHFTLANDPKGYWFFRIHRTQPEEFQITVWGWEHPHPARPRRKWLEIQDGKISTFNPEEAPDDWSP